MKSLKTSPEEANQCQMRATTQGSVPKWMHSSEMLNTQNHTCHPCAQSAPGAGLGTFVQNVLWLQSCTKTPWGCGGLRGAVSEEQGSGYARPSPRSLTPADFPTIL